MTKQRLGHVALVVVSLGAVVLSELQKTMPTSGWVAVFAALFANLRIAITPPSALPPPDGTAKVEPPPPPGGNVP